MAEYGTAQIPVAKCAGLFGLTPANAEANAVRQRLPVPAFRAGSQKSPWMIDAKQLAEYLDAAKAHAKQEWEKARA